ncbi:type II toxin-antitoxin system Phd/YefM family antitoxin [Georgenia sp. TF02-10]|uniref:type II toxin-antitoxin system prevent-host-death family antitoxin n=1 Tax=Georgenia sp. TF02-10 TaxID=2917725 RepID=UPI001FA7726A|nr:type II toxin-antitoxin system prevent-host-death family antitoxin [Georgenia sp. TF02-10]UNX55837.1 type II toxin-antitoxin system Phd/YefM family antitoxin [Georgenia sp. TF02-10]
MSAVEEISVSSARENLAGIIDAVGAEHRPVFLTRRGRRVAALVDADDLDNLLDLAEDMADIRAAAAAREEMRSTGQEPIPWESVKVDLGLA